MGIRDAINQLPSWPGFAIGTALIVSVGGWYYGTTYTKCTELRSGRDSFQAAVVAAMESSTSVLNLSDTVPGDWDEVRVVQQHRPGKTPLNCPFGWDLTWRERQALIESGRYTVIGLFKSGSFQRYVEYRGDWGDFADAPKSITRTNARFTVTKPGPPVPQYLLTFQK